MSVWASLFSILSKIGASPEDDEEKRLQKSILVVTTSLIGVAGIIWGLIYYAFDEPVAALVPLAYSCITAVNITILRFTRRFPFFRFTQLLATLLLPVLVMLALGGFVEGSVVVLWGLLAPIGALMCGKEKQAIYWFAGFVLLVVASGLLQPWLRPSNHLSEEVKTVFFVINIVAVSFIALLVLRHFFSHKDQLIAVMREKRALETAYLQQEVTLRQSEKLATLGRLSAGVAHELNNPAAAVQRGAKQLEESVAQLQHSQFRLGQMDISRDQIHAMETFQARMLSQNGRSVNLDPLTRSDRECAVEAWLESRGVEDGTGIASTMVSLGLTEQDLEELAVQFKDSQFPAIITSLGNSSATRNLIDEIGEGAGRITEIIKALKSYSYMDKAPVQAVDVHEGLENTLVMMRSRMKDGISIRRDYDEHLPRIQAYGSELNQVWTNIIDNAIDAMSGNGTLTIQTSRHDPYLVVRITDSGPGIPPEIQSKIFDPFYTTKPPGKGTGMGLNISHNIVVQKHHGTMRVQSVWGETTFEVCLPLESVPAGSAKREVNIHG